MKDSFFVTRHPVLEDNHSLSSCSNYSGHALELVDAAEWIRIHSSMHLPSFQLSAESAAKMIALAMASTGTHGSGSTFMDPNLTWNPTLSYPTPISTTTPRNVFATPAFVPWDGGVNGLVPLHLREEDAVSGPAWVSKMQLLSTSPELLTYDGSVQAPVQGGGKASVWPRVALEAFAAAAGKQCAAVAAVSSLMRAVWLCLHRYNFATRQSMLPLLLQVCTCCKSC